MAWNKKKSEYMEERINELAKNSKTENTGNMYRG
jgi:hypothetical protein